VAHDQRLGRLGRGGRVNHDGVFRFAGGADIAPAARLTDTARGKGPLHARIAEDRRSMTALWERSKDGTTWQPWMDMTFSRPD
jgi:hypothetical protein